MGPVFDSGGHTLTWDPIAGEIAASGDRGYTRGRGESHAVESDGGERVEGGTYVTIWRKTPDGQWRVTLDIGANDEPLESETP